MTTAYFSHPRYVEHTLAGHPEHAGRIQAIWQQLEAANLIGAMNAITPQPVDTDLILAVHTRQYLDSLQWVANSHQQTVLLNADTYFCPASLEIACLAAGGVVQAVDEVLSGRAANALAVIRPPGHHAVAHASMGFCLLGNVAIATKFAQKSYDLSRVMVVDFDVHHGNGTQDMLYDDPQSLFISTHQSPFYPGTGTLHEAGTGAGKGCTLNIPLRAGHGDASYAAIYHDIIWPAARRYKPQFILVSAGFDAHWEDPIAHLMLSLAGFAHITRELIAMAEELCDGKIVFALEGGYHLEALAHGIRNVAHALLGEDQISDPLGPASDQSEPPVVPLIAEIKRIHALG